MLLEASVRGRKVQSENRVQRKSQRGQASSHPQQQAAGTDEASHSSVLMGFSGVLAFKVG